VPYGRWIVISSALLPSPKLDEKTQERILRGDFGNVPERVVREAVLARG
jgi:hypothetical protein